MTKLFGTRNYMPPEVNKKGSAVSVKSDVYQLGLVLYFMLNLTLPDIDE